MMHLTTLLKQHACHRTISRRCELAGEAHLNLRAVGRLAKLYDRPTALLFMKAPRLTVMQFERAAQTRGGWPMSYQSNTNALASPVDWTVPGDAQRPRARQPVATGAAACPRGSRGTVV